MTMVRLLLFLSLLPVSCSSQELKSYSLGGNVKILVGRDLFPATRRIITLSGSYSTESDSAGNFQFNNISPGKYHLHIVGESSNSIDTSVTVVNDSLLGLRFITIADCEVSKDAAMKDIHEGKPRILLVGGIAPVSNPSDHLFEKKFAVSYYDFGCVAPAEECIIAYNKYIFSYLTSKYGKSWRRTVRTDVIGLKGK